MHKYYCMFYINEALQQTNSFDCDYPPSPEHFNSILGEALTNLYEIYGDDAFYDYPVKPKLQVKIWREEQDILINPLITSLINDEFCPIEDEPLDETEQEITLQIRFKKWQLDRLQFYCNMPILGGELVGIDFTGTAVGGDE